MKKFTSSHEWIELTQDVGTVGITNHAQCELGDIVYVELPQEGQHVQKGDDIAVLESTKAAADVYAPVSGTITSVNSKLSVSPELVNQKAEQEGWLFTIKLDDTAELEELMGQEDYNKIVQGA
jgi:glycine cleavage system H protein